MIQPTDENHEDFASSWPILDFYRRPAGRVFQRGVLREEARKRKADASSNQTRERSGAGELTPATLEVLSCIAFKQPVSQGEIDQIFGDTDKCHLVSVLRQLELVEEFAGPDGRLRFATTGKFLNQFGLEALDELRRAIQ